MLLDPEEVQRIEQRWPEDRTDEEEDKLARHHWASAGVGPRHMRIDYAPIPIPGFRELTRLLVSGKP